MTKKVAVIGAGTMGNGIAHVFALNNYQVTLCDIDPGQLDRALNTISLNLDRMLKKGTIHTDDKVQTLMRIQTSKDLSILQSGVDLVIEAVTENETVKMSILKKLSEIIPGEVPLASNTSSISITRLATAVSNPERVIGMHFMNPVPVMPLIEVIRGHHTSDHVTGIVMEISRDLGKTPVEVHDYPGFVANRILMPMINEAIWTLHEGVAGREGIDTVMKLGMSHPMGPLELADYIGLDVCLAILQVLYQGLGNPKYAPCPLLVKLVNAGDLGKKAGKGFYAYKTS